MSILPGPPDNVREPWQRDVVGDALQLRWPLRDQYDLRWVGEIFRDFGNRLISLSQAKEGQPRSERNGTLWLGRRSNGRLCKAGYRATRSVSDRSADLTG